MKRLTPVRLGVVVAALVSCGAAWAQALPTATQTLDISVFAAGTGTYTELNYGRNAGITAGVDLTFRNYFHLRPSLEVRGNYAIDQGQVDGQKSVLIGPRLQKSYGRFTPYIDGFYGRGELTYNGGIIVNNFRYDRTTTNVFAGGGGLDFRVTRHFDAKAEVQFERFGTPVISTGEIYPIPISFGAVYHLDLNQYGHRHKHPKEPKIRPPAPAPADVYTAPPLPPGSPPKATPPASTAPGASSSSPLVSATPPLSPQT